MDGALQVLGCIALGMGITAMILITLLQEVRKGKLPSSTYNYHYATPRSRTRFKHQRHHKVASGWKTR